MRELAMMEEYNSTHKVVYNSEGLRAIEKGVCVTQDNLQDILSTITEEDKNYLLANNINIINPLTRRIGKRFKHYFEVVKDCQHKHTVRHSYERRSGDSYFTVCTDCGMNFLE
jgi:hypothetical protein